MLVIWLSKFPSNNLKFDILNISFWLFEGVYTHLGHILCPCTSNRYIYQRVIIRWVNITWLEGGWDRRGYETPSSIGLLWVGQCSSELIYAASGASGYILGLYIIHQYQMRVIRGNMEYLVLKNILLPLLSPSFCTLSVSSTSRPKGVIIRVNITWAISIKEISGLSGLS